MRSVAKLMMVVGLLSVLSACAMKGSCQKGHEHEHEHKHKRSEGMMKQYGGK